MAFTTQELYNIYAPTFLLKASIYKAYRLKINIFLDKNSIYI